MSGTMMSFNNIISALKNDRVYTEKTTKLPLNYFFQFSTQKKTYLEKKKFSFPQKAMLIC
jgi:hypothetical protein